MLRLATPFLLTAISLAPAGALAQSGSSSSPRPAYQGTPVQQGSGSTPVMQGSGSAMSGQKPAMDGYCPVCIAMGKGWVAGSTQFQAQYDGEVYRFPKAEALAAFQAEPAKFVPVLGGDDVVEYTRTGKRVDGELKHGAQYLDRLYFFATEANKSAFRANPTQYANADLAAGGACVVCRVDMQRDMPGVPQHVSVHEGVRYQFAGPQQLEAFKAQPRRYAIPAPTNRPAGSGSAGR